MKIAIFLLGLVALVWSTPLVKRQAGPGSYVLPSGAELIVANIKSSFSCANRIYGYYADTDNNCQVFHVCVPIEDTQGAIIDTAIYSFFCGNQTVFDQQNLVCADPTVAVPCGSAASLYDEVNRNFGITDRPQQG